MPCYTYKCRKCASTFDTHQPISEDPLTECRSCNGSIYRLIGKGVGIKFVGSGFYINDSSKPATSSTQSKSSST